MSQSEDDWTSDEHHSFCADEGNSCSTSCHEIQQDNIAGKDLDFEMDAQSSSSSRENKSLNKAFMIEETECYLSHAEEKEITEKVSETVDIEEGEIQDTSSVESLDTYTCRYYQTGKCSQKRKCRFSNKGMYNMFEKLATVPRSIHCPPKFYQEPHCFVPPPPSVEETETNWDRELKEAMERVKKVGSRVTLFLPDKLRMVIRRDKCIIKKRTHSESPRKSKHSQSLTHRILNSFPKKEEPRYAVSIAKLKSDGKERTYRTNYHLDWKDPWRRSKSPQKRKGASSRSICDSSRSRSRCRLCVEKSPCRRCRSRISKRVRREASFRVSNSRRRRSSTSSESSNTFFKKVYNSSSYKRRESSFHHTNSKVARSSYSPIDRDSSLDAKRIVRRQPSPPKSTVTKKLASSFPKSCSPDTKRIVRCHPSPPKPTVTKNLSFSFLKSGSLNAKRKVRCHPSPPKPIETKNLTPSFLQSSSLDAKRIVRCLPSPPKPILTKNLTSSFPKSSIKSCSDMSISPVSNSSLMLGRATDAGPEDHLTDHFSDRHLRDMSISPFSDATSFGGVSGCNENIVPEVPKSSPEKVSLDVVSKVSSIKDLSNSYLRQESSDGKIICSGPNVSNSNTKTRMKKQASNSLFMDLMKYHGNFKRSNSTKEQASKNVPSKCAESKNVPSKAVSKTADEKSKIADMRTQPRRNVTVKIKEEMNENQTKLSKKEMLLRRLQEVDAAIARKKIYALRKALGNH